MNNSFDYSIVSFAFESVCVSLRLKVQMFAAQSSQVFLNIRGYVETLFVR